jgi:HAD superfamily hydrolase (TIGR01549 family)
MKETRIRALIWDLDGTLVHFKIDYLRARRAAIKILKLHGIPKNELTITKSILENLMHSIEIFKKKNYSLEKINQIKTEINDAVSAIEYEAALEATKINGIEDILKFAKKNQLKQAIYTYNTHKNAEVSLKTVKLLKYFDVIVGRDDVANPKPHRDHLLMICKELNVKPLNVIVIGDTYRDIQGALELGAKSIAIQTPTSKFSNISIFQQADIIIQQEDISKELMNSIASFL